MIRKPLTDLERAAAKAIMRDMLIKLETYIFDVVLAAQGQANGSDVSREALIEAAFDLAALSDA